MQELEERAIELTKNAKVVQHFVCPVCRDLVEHDVNKDELIIHAITTHGRDMDDLDPAEDL